VILPITGDGCGSLPISYLKRVKLLLFTHPNLFVWNQVT